MPLALVMILIVIGSVGFHFLSPWWMTPIASNWGFIDDTITVTFIITGVVFTVVVLFVAYCLIKFRHVEGRKAAYEPENRRLEGWLTVITAIGVMAMLTPGLFVWAQFIKVPDGSAQAEVIGRQWQWGYRLPGADGKLGKTDVSFVSDTNTFGLNPNDPASADDILIDGDYLHFPIDKPVEILMRSLDTVHNFNVPELRSKMDMIPGTVTYFWFTPTRTGTYEVLCAELCGIGHPYMRGGIVIESPEEYDTWLAQQSTFEQLSAQAAKAPGETRLASR